MKSILTVFKKELTRFLTDRRMLVTLIMPGILIFLVYSLMGNFMGSMFGGDDVSPDTQYIVYIENRPQGFEVFDSPRDMKIAVNPDDGAEQAILDKISDETAHLYIVYEEGFGDKLAAGEKPNVDIYYNSLNVQSQYVYAYYTACLERALSRYTLNGDANKSYDVAEESDVASYVITMILPMLLNVLLLSGCLAVASESVAGEKERGTIATLLVTPVKRGYLVLGKVFALALLALVSATSSFLGLIFSLPSLIGVELSAISYGFGEYAALFGVIVITVLLFTVVLTIISTFAKSVKEATALATPVMVLVMVMSLATSLFSIEGIAGYFVPFFNMVLCMTSILSMSFSPVGFLITLAVDAAAFALGVFAIVKMFNSEKVMFNK